MSSRFALARHMHVVSSSKTSMESFLFSFPRAPYPVVLIIHYRFCIYHDQTCRATYWGTPYRSPRPAMLYIITKEEVAVMWYDGQGDRMGIATSANTVCIHHRAENSVPHPFVPFIRAFSFWLVRDERTAPTPQDDMAGLSRAHPVSRLLCLHAAARRHYSHDECTRWASGTQPPPPSTKAEEEPWHCP